MFQYAVARSLSLRLGEELVLDPHWFSHQLPGETVRPLELTRYPVRQRLATPQEQRKWRVLRSRWNRFLGPLRPMTLLRETPGAYNASISRARPDTYLFGFWQSEKYFKDIRTNLLEELSPVAPPSPQDAEVLASIERGDAISVHIRRGDYVSSSSAAAFHGVCSMDYYERAIEHVARQLAKPVLYIFSDDPDWTRQNLKSPYPSHYVNHNSPADAFQDLRLMSHCKHHVIANSSFSWWGAWLATSPDKIVVAPRNWFLSGLPTTDLIPHDWVRL